MTFESTALVTLDFIALGVVVVMQSSLSANKNCLPLTAGLNNQ